MNLSGTVHQELEQEELYKDMEFELNNETDKLELKLVDLKLR